MIAGFTQTKQVNIKLRA